MIRCVLVIMHRSVYTDFDEIIERIVARGYTFILKTHQNDTKSITPRHHNNHTTTSQYSIQRQPSNKNSSIDSIVQHEYFVIILGKVLFNINEPYRFFEEMEKGKEKKGNDWPLCVSSSKSCPGERGWTRRGEKIGKDRVSYTRWLVKNDRFHHFDQDRGKCRRCTYGHDVPSCEGEWDHCQITQCCVWCTSKWIMTNFPEISYTDLHKRYIYILIILPKCVYTQYDMQVISH